MRPIKPQRVGQTPGVHPIRFVAAGHLALAIPLGAARMHWKYAAFPLHQPFDDRAVFGLDGNRHIGKRGEFFAELFPSASRMVEPKIGDRFSAGIQDDDIVMVFSPIESGVVFNFIPCFHNFCIVDFG